MQEHNSILKEKKNNLPPVIQNKIDELETLIQKYPNKIPTTVVAKFLGMDIECLRRGIEQGSIPFALGCNNDKYGNRYTYVSTTTFYLWYIAPLIKWLKYFKRVIENIPKVWYNFQ